MPWGVLGWGNTLSVVESGGGGGGGDGNPPVVTYDPPPDTPVGRYQPVRISITDETGVVGLIVEVFYDGFRTSEIVFSENTFQPAFVGESYIQGPPTNLLLYVKRSGGWIETPRLRVIAWDNGGNITS